VTWINANGGPMEEHHWTDPTIHCFGMLLDGRAPTTGRRQPGKEMTVLVLVNGHHEPVQFTLPTCVGASEWSLLLDTNLPERPQDQTFKMGTQYLLTDRSLVLLVLGVKRTADVIPV
jgi:glycogen operon protein